MTTATGDISINLSGVADANPYTNALITNFGADLRVFNEKFRVWGAGGGFYTADNPSSGKIRSTIEIGSDAGDSFGCALINTGLNGYYVECRYDYLLVFLIVNGNKGAQIKSLGANAMVAGDLVALEMDSATGAYEVFLNNVSVGAGSDSTYNGLRAGYYYLVSDYADTGAKSWAANGYGATDTITPDSTIEVGGSANFTYTGFASGAINAGDLGNQALIVSGSTITLPDSFNVTDGAVVSPLGSQTINLGNGTETAASTMTVTLPTGITETTMATVDTATPLSMYALLLTVGQTLTTGDKIRFDSSDGSTLTDAGIYDWALPKYFTYINSSNQAYNYRMVASGVESVVRKLTASKMHGAKLSSTKLRVR